MTKSCQNRQAANSCGFKAKKEGNNKKSLKEINRDAKNKTRP